MYNRINQDQNRNNRRINFYSENDFNMQNDPRKENFCNFIKGSFCPQFKFLSITYLIFMINLIIFIIMLTQGIETSKSKNLSFLAIKDSTLKQYGSLVIYNFDFKKMKLIFLKVLCRYKGGKDI